MAVAIAAWQSSDELNSFSSFRDKALADDKKNDDGQFPLRTFSNKQNLGHDLFYGITSDLNPTGKNAGCAACHNGLPGQLGADPKSTGVEDHQLYTDGRFHHIGVPFNREIPGVAKGEKVGVAAHAPTTTVVDVTNFPSTFTAPTPAGFFKTPTLRNVAKGAGDPESLTPKGFIKAYTHNGYFKSLKQIVHFYNTRDDRPVCAGFPNSDQATAAEAIAHNCWPRPEFDTPSVFGAGNAPGDGLGNLGLDDAEENDIVAYLETLSDDTTPQPPTATKSKK